MKIAIAGKGGSGKTSISGTMARLLARNGRRVLAIDGDSNPNLGLTLGVTPRPLEQMPTLPRDVVRRANGEVELTSSLDEIVSTHGMRTPDGVDLLVMAHPQHAGAG